MGYPASSPLQPRTMMSESFVAASQPHLDLETDGVLVIKNHWLFQQQRFALLLCDEERGG